MAIGAKRSGGARRARKATTGMALGRRRAAGRRTGAARRVGSKVKPGRRAAATRTVVRWRREGVKLGSAWRNAHPSGAKEGLRDEALRHWRSVARTGASDARPTSWPYWKTAGLAFARGVREGAGIAVPIMPIALGGKAAAVVHAGTDPGALSSALAQLSELPLEEIVVVLGDAQEELWSAARACANAVVAHLPHELEPGVGRALGAQLTGADIVLFVDGHRPVPAEELAAFLWRCDGGLDAALNDCAAGDDPFHRRGAARWMKEFLNLSLGRPDLKTNALDTLPFALSRKALDAVGAASLAALPKAHAALLLRGLKVGIGGRAPWTAQPAEGAAGEYAEAWREAIAAKGPRLQFQDKVRNRSVLGGSGL
ncbi:hypothetical protein [Cohnella sp. REN36]|nr:hypothetical protein [Cohnella sp. REN36]